VPLKTPVVVLKVTPDGNVPVSASEGVGSPVATAVKVPAAPSVKTVLSALVMVGATPGGGLGPQPLEPHATMNKVKNIIMPTEKNLLLQQTVLFILHLSSRI
jgi:hypothetical protein